MMTAAGMVLLVLPALYAGLMVWLRGGWMRHLTPPAPLSCGEGGASSSFNVGLRFSENKKLGLALETSSPSPRERGPGGEVPQ